MVTLISNSVFWSVVPAPADRALLAISDTTPFRVLPGSASTSISAGCPMATDMTSFSSTLTWASITDRSATMRMTSFWNCDPSAISPCSLFRALIVPDIGA